MAKSIHERVRAAQEKRERDAKRAVDKAHDKRMRSLERRDMRAEARIEGLRNGTIIPRNAHEDAIQCDALDDLVGG